MRTIGLGLLALFAALPLAAQLRESVTVEVIDVPVYVFNDDGPVRGLAKDDFELYVNGTKRAIDYFDAIDLAPAAQTPAVIAAPRDLRERRLFLLLFDLVFARSASVDRARKAAVTMIDAAGPADYFAVAVFTRTAGIKLLAPFSNDHALARSAAITLAEPSERDPLSIALPKNEVGNEVYVAPSTGGKHSRDEVLRDETVLSMYAFDTLHDNVARPVQHLIEDQTAELDRIAARLSQLEGYKHVVLFSEGFPPGLVYTSNYTSDGVLLAAMNAMFESFRRANAVVDTVDIGGNESFNVGSSRGLRDGAARTTSTSDALRMVAAETGGQFVGSRNDVKAALQQISTVSQTGYRLGFARPADAKDGANTIEVRVRNLPRGTNVSYRKGFSTTKPEATEADALRLADILLNDIPQTGVAPRIEFGEKPLVEVQVPEAAITNGKGLVLFYVFDESGKAVSVKARNVTGGAVLRGKLELPPGQYVAKALVQSGSAIGFTRVAFAIR